MFGTFWLRSTDLFGIVRARVQKLQDRAGTSDASKHRTLRPWIILITGLALGLLGYNTVHREARERWLIEHSPPRALWEKTLQERGYLGVSDEGTLMKIRGEFPHLRAGSERIWILENRRGLLVLSHQDLLLFSYLSKNPPSFVRSDWEPLGFGWDAFEAFLGLSLPLREPDILTHKALKSSPGKDPREIRY